MAAKKFDVIIIGAGPNGLELGAYLSKAGQKVLLLERRNEVGGGLATEAVTIGTYLHNTHAIYMMMVDYAPVYQDCRLEEDYNLRHIHPELQFALPLQALADKRHAQSPLRNAQHHVVNALGLRQGQLHRFSDGATEELFFAANDGASGMELWKTTDGAVVSQVADILTGPEDSDPAFLTTVDNGTMARHMIPAAIRNGGHPSVPTVASTSGPMANPADATIP